ncbi:hypothetical protein [Labrys monachus]|uniref:Uncharacterized protein n=1 Tax=Labrys monachus TaxID=217067 RepID=A0ABU0FHV0_9HYPH|nr:hypothetical protein [Labrys monachus]MDQ0394177.1 hypothetical protein [Labrys monachus]
MKSICILAGLMLICLPAAVARADDAASGLPPAPVGHLQPRPAAPPVMPDNDSSGVSSKDDPARLDKELEPSTDRAIHSLCSYCLKPEGQKRQR